VEADDFIELLNASDLPEVREVVGAWWEPLYDGGHACGMVAVFVGGERLYLESLCFAGEPPQHASKVLKTTQPWPSPLLYVTALHWSTDVGPIMAELDRAYHRGGGSD
jgi:hypothetical protein